MKKLLFVLLFFSLIGLRAPAQAPLDNADQVVDKISARERALVESFKDYIPIAETYLQELALRGNTAVVVHDHYFLGQAKLGPDVDILPFKGTRKGSPITDFAKSMFSVKMEYLPEGFAQMVHPDVDGFDRDHYSFNYLQRDLLGEVDCLVFDVLPLGKYAKKAESGLKITTTRLFVTRDFSGVGMIFTVITSISILHELRLVPACGYPLRFTPRKKTTHITRYPHVQRWLTPASRRRRVFGVMSRRLLAANQN